MNKKEREVLKDVLSEVQVHLGCDEEDREASMKKYDVIDSIIKKLRLYQ